MTSATRSAAIFVCIAALLPAQAPPLPKVDPAVELDPLLKEFVNALTLVQAEGADEQTPDKLIFEGAIPAMLRKLDPHTQFFQPSQFEQLQQMEQSEQKGFGSIVSVLPGQVIFLQTLPGTPSNRSGIQPGDELVGVNNIAIARLQPQEIIELLTEARQQRVTVFLRRQGTPRLLPVTLTPELVDQPSVDRAYFLQPDYGYIRVTSWDLQTAKQLKEAIEKLGGAKLKGLVLDLRNNPGGVVKAALDGASLFLKPGQLILTARGRVGDGEPANVAKTAQPYGFKLAVLMNEKSASASEILAGALQDHDRATIVGEPSYGKGLVQSVMPLASGAGLALTTAFYYTPSGRSIQKPLRDSTLSDTFHRDSEAARPVYKTDNGRTVLGGGGIQPDVPVTPEGRTRLEGAIDASGATTSYATQYLSTHTPLPDSFEVTPELLDDFKVYLSQRNIQPSIAEWASDRLWITNKLKEEVVTQARGVDKGDEIAAQRDPQIQEALKTLR